MEVLRRQHREARARLGAAIYDYFAGGAGDERTLAENEEAGGTYGSGPASFAASPAARPAVELLGAQMAAPIVLAPAALQRLLHPGGEIAVARAAARAGW
jgi:4-hydroxymandelate oxidase